MLSYVTEPSPWLAIISLVGLVALTSILKLHRLMPASNNRLASIDSLRGILALSVFFHHFTISYQMAHTGGWTTPVSTFYSLLGGGGVMLFFMITGFLFFGKLKAVRGHINFNRFFIGRVFRIMPLYIFSVVIVYLIVAWQSEFAINEPLENSLDLWILFTAPTVNGLSGSTLINAGVQWTLAYEWMFYLTLPVVSFVWRKLNNDSWVVFALCVAIVWMSRSIPTLPSTNLSTILLMPFALGGLASELGQSKDVRRLATGAWGTFCAVISTVILFTQIHVSSSLSAFCLLFLIFTPISLGNSLFGVLRMRSMIFLGEISYDIYLIHGCTLYVFFHIAMPNAFATARTNGRLLSLMLLTSLAVLVLSVLAHILVERPALRLGRRFLLIDRVQSIAAP